MTRFPASATKLLGVSGATFHVPPQSSYSATRQIGKLFLLLWIIFSIIDFAMYVVFFSSLLKGFLVSKNVPLDSFSYYKSSKTTSNVIN